MPSSRSFDGSVPARPDILSVNSSIPEETAVEIADTSYAPLASPDEPPERPSLMSAYDVDGQKLDERRAAAVMRDQDAVSPATAVKGEVLSQGNELLPNGKGVQSASAASKPTSMSRLRSVLVAAAAVLICTLIGAIVMFEFGGTAPLSTSLHALPRVHSHFHRKFYHQLRAAVGGRQPS